METVENKARSHGDHGEGTEEKLLYGELTEKILGAAIEVHRHLGPGLLENIYRQCLLHELALRGIRTATEVEVPLVYKGKQLEPGYRLDVLVEGKIIVELKAANALEPVHQFQLLTYMRLRGVRVGLLVNFNVPVLMQGVKRMIL
jgi:GxxExxY protein